MNFRSLLLTLTAAAIAAIAVLNWNTLATSVPVSLGVVTVDAPLGIVMLALTALLAAFALAYVLWLQGSVLIETRRHGKEMQVQRELADKAEASRFTELRSFLEVELQKLGSRGAGSSTAADPAIVLARLDRLEKELLSALEHSENSVAAYVGELEDRLERKDALPDQ